MKYYIRQNSKPVAYFADEKTWIFPNGDFTPRTYDSVTDAVTDILKHKLKFCAVVTSEKYLRDKQNASTLNTIGIGLEFLMYLSRIGLGVDMQKDHKDLEDAFSAGYIAGFQTAAHDRGGIKNVTGVDN